MVGKGPLMTEVSFETKPTCLWLDKLIKFLKNWLTGWK